MWKRQRNVRSVFIAAVPIIGQAEFRDTQYEILNRNKTERFTHWKTMNTGLRTSEGGVNVFQCALVVEVAASSSKYVPQGEEI